jgi:predicted molibdopterin-dependent oxidoreductase YjgC
MSRILVDGVAVELAEGALLTAALGCPPVAGCNLAGAPRGPLCGMGQCFECLVQVDGREVLACLTPAVEGMVVRRG